MENKLDKTRINKMVLAIKKVRAGDYSVRLDVSKKMDILDTLAHGINRMIYEVGMGFEEFKKRVKSEKAQEAILHMLLSVKKAENKYKESEKRFRDVALSTSVMIWEIDENGKYTYCSDKVRDILGYEYTEIIGKTPFDLMIPDDAAAIGKLFESLSKHREPVRDMINWNLTKDGKKVCLVTNGVPILDENGNFKGYRGVNKDITKQKINEAALNEMMSELKRSNKDLEQFAYIASHDLQEPIKMVIMNLDLLQREYKGKLDPDADMSIKYAVDGARRMCDLINDLLMYSRIGKGYSPKKPLNCEDIIGLALTNLEESVKDSNAEVTHGKLPVITANETQMIQLFQNLIGNGIKYRGGKTPKIHISAGQKSGEWIFSFQDNGIGIEKEFTGIIFEVFQRLHSREEYPGTGIGLAVCKKIVEQHGGRIWVESVPKEGSTFLFTIPIVSNP